MSLKPPFSWSPARSRHLAGIGALVCLVVVPAAPSSAEVTAREGEIEIPTYPWEPPVRHPYFRATDGRNIYPYPMLDNLQRLKEPRRWKTVVLENEYLRVTFLPELGGKIYEVFDKTASQQVFYVNRVVKPGLIGQCGAWVSGGIEFNTGPQGHTVSAVLPVDVQILPRASDGSRSVAVGEVERIYGTRWTVVVTLRPGRSFLEERIRIYNRTERVRPYYFWNCTAVPNTPGFRFVYPMTLGTDHSGKTFYTWPIADGKDLSLGKSYQDASSIFAYECDQDFFGSYDEDADRGVVAFANHRELPGKKAWTWGQGSYGTMHQMDLTDEDGPYNEVQTGPLPTQADVGRLDPHEAITWQEWWYPVRGIGGFTYANRDVAVNARRAGEVLELRMLGTGTWASVEIRALREGTAVASLGAALRPEAATVARLDTGSGGRLEVEVLAAGAVLARFPVPLELPVRKPPEARKPADTASELVRDGWQDILFARLPEAEDRFRKALSKDPAQPDARCGLACLRLDADPDSAATEARTALGIDPDHGLARYFLAAALLQSGRDAEALDEAYMAALDPRVAGPARSLAAKVLLRRGDWEGAVAALSAPGPWQADPVSMGRLALAFWRRGDIRSAAALAERSLEIDPLDSFARGILWLAGRESLPLSLARLIAGKPQSVLELTSTLADLGQEADALRVLEAFHLSIVPEDQADPEACAWGAYLSHRAGKEEQASRYLQRLAALSPEGVFPHRIETVPVLRWAVEADPRSGNAALQLGHLLVSLGRTEEGRRSWRRAVELGAAPVVALRALGMASLKLDGNAEEAAALFEEAHRADPGDPIVAIDLARVLFDLADKAGDDVRRGEILQRIRERLTAALPRGKGRSDFVALLARASNRLGDYQSTARLLDSVRITIWEGAREAHDLYEEAHVALGKAHLEGGRPLEALRELDRSLEYPENLATGRLEDTREAHIQYLRGRALEALGRKEEALAAWKKAAGEPESKDATKEEARRLSREAIQRLGG